MNVLDAKRWLDYAYSDQEAAQALLNNPELFPRQVCFLAQQAAEKALKAILILLEIEFPFTHDLDRLRESIPSGWRVKAEFPKLYGLSIWAVKSRSPGDMPDVLDIDAQQAVNFSEAILECIKEDFVQFT